MRMTHLSNYNHRAGSQLKIHIQFPKTYIFPITYNKINSSYNLWQTIFLGEIVYIVLISFIMGNCILWEMVLWEVVYFPLNQDP